MTNDPHAPGRGPRWVDPDAPTSVGPQQQRPEHGARQPEPPTLQTPAAPPLPHQAPHPASAYQQPPWPGAHQGPGLPPGGYPPAGGPPSGDRTRKPLIIGLAGALVVAVVAVIAIVAFSGNDTANTAGGADGPSADLSPGDTVKAYLQALSDGDATKALAFGNSQPASTDLLTDDVLRKQLAKMPISNIRILDEDTTSEFAGLSSVHVAVNFGDVVNDQTLNLKRDGDQHWKLDTAVIKVDKPYEAAAPDSTAATITLFGKDFKNSALYVFPGYMEVASTNQYVDATAEPLLLDALTSYGGRLGFTVALNEEGRTAIHDQIAAAYAKCQASNLLAPPGCPLKLSGRGAVEGTVTWGATDLSGLQIDGPSVFSIDVRISGDTTTPVSVRTTSGEITQVPSTDYVLTTADITKSPPQVNLG